MKVNKISKNWKDFYFLLKFILSVIEYKNTKINNYKCNLIIYLTNTSKHYKDLSKLMNKQNKEKYKNEHLSKVKFIDLLLMKIIENDF